MSHQDTEVCEQSFRWLGRMKIIMRSMNPVRFEYLVRVHVSRVVGIFPLVLGRAPLDAAKFHLCCIP